MEPRFGANFAGVRVHADREAGQLTTQLHARAFTSGHDIYFGPGTYEPSSRAGQVLLAHELTHVVQQRGHGAAVQRAVGFEFEDQTWTVLTLQPGKPFRKPGWFGGKPAPPGSEKTAEETAEEKYTGKNIWAGADSGGHINNLVGGFNLQTAPKKGLLHKGKHYAIEPDGPYTEHGVANRMDLEIVTEPFPETATGFSDLLSALADLQGVFDRFNRGATGEWKGDPFEYDKFVGPESHGFSRPGLYLYGGTPGGHFKPQVTGGIQLADVPRVMATLGARHDETAEQETEAAPMRRLVYGTDNPEELAKSATIAILGRAPRLANAVLAALTSRYVLDRDAEGIDELRGFLSLLLVHMAVLSVTSKEGIKTQMPLLSRYPMSELWRRVPEPARDAVADEEDQLLRALHPATQIAVRIFLKTKFPQQTYGQMVDERSGEGLGGPMIRAHLRETVGGVEQQAVALTGALGSFTRRQWVSEILAGRDLLTPDALIARLKAAGGGQKAAAEQYDKSIAIFLRGHGNTANVKDVAGEEREALALLENRNITAGPMSFGEILVLAQQYFRWLVSVRTQRPELELRS